MTPIRSEHEPEPLADRSKTEWVSAAVVSGSHSGMGMKSGRPWNRDMRRGALAWMFACMLALLSTRAHAQPSLEPTATPKADAPRPWAAGVSESEQAVALKLYVAGNLEFAESRFAQALAKYKEAIQHWEHPAIRYNMAVCLINLDQPLEAK